MNEMEKANVKAMKKLTRKTKRMARMYRIRQWFYENEEEIFGYTMFALGCIGTGLGCGLVMRSEKAKSYLDGVVAGAAFGHDCMLRDIPGMEGMDPENVIVVWKNENGADFAMSKFPDVMNEIYSSGFTADNVKTVRDAMFIEMDHRNSKYDIDTVVSHKLEL